MASDDVYTGGTEPLRPAAPGDTPVPATTPAPTWTPPVQQGASVRWQQPSRPPKPTPDPSGPTLAEQLSQRSERFSTRLIATLVISLIVVVVLPMMLLGRGLSSSGIDRPRPPRETSAPVLQFGESAEYISYSALGAVTVLDAQWWPAQTRQDGTTDVLAVEVSVEITEGEQFISAFTTEAITRDGFRYRPRYLSNEPASPRFEGKEMRAGASQTGWIYFEMPQQDVVFLFSSYDEETIRVQIEGGPTPPPLTAPIPIDQTFPISEYRGSGEGAIVQAAWVVADKERPKMMHLAVQVRLTVDSGSLWPLSSSLKLVDSLGQEYQIAYYSVGGYVPSQSFSRVYAGDSVTGWLTWIADRQDLTLVYRTGQTTVEVPIPG